MPTCEEHRPVDINIELVMRLIESQFPQYAALPLEAVQPGGWDNQTLRLGQEFPVRLPSAERYVAQVEKEHRWLPKLAPRLPLPIPAPLATPLPKCGPLHSHRNGAGNPFGFMATSLQAIYCERRSPWRGH